MEFEHIGLITNENKDRGFVRAGFYEYEDGSVLELMQYLGDEKQWFGSR